MTNVWDDDMLLAVMCCKTLLIAWSNFGTVHVSDPRHAMHTALQPCCWNVNGINLSSTVQKLSRLQHYMHSSLCTHLTKLGEHEQGDECEVLVRDEATGCSIKVQDCIVVS